MASRTRVISQNKAVYVTPTGWHLTGAGADITHQTITGHQLHRVDTLSFDMDLAGARQDVREFGQLARIGTVSLTEINPTLSLGYFLVDGENELALGFTSSKTGVGAAAFEGQMASGMLVEDPIISERNVWVLTAKEGEDAFNSSVYEDQAPNHDVIGFGNCFISSYSASFGVGEIPRADVELQASNIVFWTGAHDGLYTPSLDLEGERNFTGLTNLPAPNTGDMSALVLRPQDVSVTFSNNDIIAQGIGGATSLSALPVQSASVELPLAREVIESLGTELAYAKLLEFPIDVTLSVSALMREFGDGALEYALTGTAGDLKTNITLDVNNGDQAMVKYQLKNAVLDNQSFSQGLDDNETVDLTFSAQIGGASTTDQGLFFFNQTGVIIPAIEEDAHGSVPSFSGGPPAPAQPITPKV